jgi:hypothetical protein
MPGPGRTINLKAVSNEAIIKWTLYCASTRVRAEL